jgi:hypothetical protein
MPDLQPDILMNTTNEKQLHRLIDYYYYYLCLTQYFSGDKIDKNLIDGACSTYGEKRGVYRILVGKPEGKRPPGSPRHRWEDNIKLDHQEVGCEDMEWIDLAQYRGRWRAL